MYYMNTVVHGLVMEGFIVSWAPPSSSKAWTTYDIMHLCNDHGTWSSDSMYMTKTSVSHKKL